MNECGICGDINIGWFLMFVFLSIYWSIKKMLGLGWCISWEVSVDNHCAKEQR